MARTFAACRGVGVAAAAALCTAGIVVGGGTKSAGELGNGAGTEAGTRGVGADAVAARGFGIVVDVSAQSWFAAAAAGQLLPAGTGQALFSRRCLSLGDFAVGATGLQREPVAANSAWVVERREAAAAWVVFAVAAPSGNHDPADP